MPNYFLQYLHHFIFSQAIHEDSKFFTSHQYLFLFCFVFLKDILVGVKCYLMVFNCISLVINDIEHDFMCLLANCVFSLGKCLLRPFAHIHTASFTIKILHHKSAFVTIKDPTLTHHYHLKLIVYIRVHTWCSTVYGF